MLPLITLDIRTSRSTPDSDAYNYYNRYNYDVKLLTDDDREIFIGKGSSVLYLCEKAMNEGFDILHAFDDNHHEEIYDLLYDVDVIDGTEGMKDEWEDLIAENDSFNSNILVSDRLEILPEYQHHGYGKVVRHILRDFFSGCYGLEILHSFPLQFERFDNSDPWRAQMRYDTMSHDAIHAHASLNHCYLRTGYTQYQETEYFYRFPSVETLDETEWEEDECKDIDFSRYEEDFYSSLDNKSFKQVDPGTFIVIGKCKLVSKEDKNQTMEVDLEKVYRHHPDLFEQWQHFEFDLSPIGLSKHVKVLIPEFSGGIRFAKAFLSQNQYVCFLFEILDTLGFEYCGRGNMSYNFGRDYWSKSHLQELKRKGLLVFRLLEYGTCCYVDVILSKEEAHRRGITKWNLCDNYKY